MKVKALTLVELVVVIVIIGILIIGLSRYVVQAVDTWDFLSDRSDIVNGIRLGMMRMGRDIRQIRQTPDVADADSLEFIKLDSGSDLRLRFDHEDANDRVVLTVDTDGDDDLSDETSYELMDRVTAFTFRYFDDQAAELTPPIADLSDIYRVKIELTLTQRGEDIELQYGVFPRMLR